MRRANSGKHRSILGISAVAVIVAGTVLFIGSSLNKPETRPAPESKEYATDNTLSAPEENSGSQAIEMTNPEDTTLNQEGQRTGISASKQSSLEKAIDDLIKLTESDG